MIFPSQFSRRGHLPRLDDCKILKAGKRPLKIIKSDRDGAASGLLRGGHALPRAKLWLRGSLLLDLRVRIVNPEVILVFC